MKEKEQEDEWSEGIVESFCIHNHENIKGRKEEEVEDEEKVEKDGRKEREDRYRGDCKREREREREREGEGK